MTNAESGAGHRAATESETAALGAIPTLQALLAAAESFTPAQRRAAASQIAGARALLERASAVERRRRVDARA